MHAIAYWGLLLALLLSVFSGIAAAVGAAAGRQEPALWAARGHVAVTAIITLCSTVLFMALASRDYSFLYVFEYTDNILPMFYTLTAFWAGQDGSLLFWAWMVALAGLVFMFTPAYRNMGATTRSWYWAFFMASMAFFLLLLTNWSSPFKELSPAPANGRGLNPLLQNPGMIFHPPLLFLGYAGFTVPAALALAARLGGEPGGWLQAGRPWIVFSWIFLSAGIILGGWWSYMELGWGGYWAWDPVENASLIPWLSATALLHTGVIEARRSSLAKTNVFLAVLTLALCFFGTYLVRSGVIDSLHAFGAGGVATPLLVFIFTMLAFCGLALFAGDAGREKPLSGLASRQGLLVMAAWAFVALGLVVLLGTMWPVISKLWSANPVGFDAGFYNRVCLPLFVLLSVLLVFCPWFGWKGGLRYKKHAYASFAVFAGALVALFALGVRQPLALVGAASAVGVMAGTVLLLVSDKALRAQLRSFGFAGVHLGLALMVLGVAFSGPYHLEREAKLSPGDAFSLGDYVLEYESHRELRTANFAAVEATLAVSRDGRHVGTLTPQRRGYVNFDQPFAEVSTVFSLGTELYATLLAIQEDGTASVKASLNPLVNWVWIGGTLLCLAGFLCLAGPKRRSRGV